jgi:8-oxo-dGTP diphosphatase
MEEIRVELTPGDLHLTGLVSEHGFQGQTHWLMFLFEVRKRLAALPVPCDEGVFGFYTRAEMERLRIPDTDREQIWPLFWRHRGGFFAAHCHCKASGQNVWTIEESVTTQRE